MSTWKQEIANEITPLEGVNKVSASIQWNITVRDDPDSPLPPSGGEVTIERTLAVRGLKAVSERLVDQKNYLSGDFVTVLAFEPYRALRAPQTGDPEIVNNGRRKTLDEMRPMNRSYGFEPGVDTLTVAGDSKAWTICRVDAIGLMDDDTTGLPAPAKLQLTLRR